MDHLQVTYNSAEVIYAISYHLIANIRNHLYCGELSQVADGFVPHESAVYTKINPTLL
jgi:hypothetical protein